MYACILRDLLTWVSRLMAPYLIRVGLVGVWFSFLVIAILLAWTLFVAALASVVAIVFVSRRHVRTGG